jgi:ankyrin repeat protein
MAGVDVNIPNKKGITPISAAAHKGRSAILQKLIDAGALVNAVNSSGSAPLIQAAHFGHHACVEMLLDNGANPDFANVKGTTALMRAAQEGYPDICELLLQSLGVHVNRKNYEGMNAIMLGSQRGHAETVKVLVDYRANMDERTAQGSTALMLACKRGNEAVVRVLVSMGAEICVRDIHGRTASDTAIKYHNDFLLALLSTQVQLALVRDEKRLQRTGDLLTLRDAFNARKLRVSHEGQLAIEKYKAARSARLQQGNSYVAPARPAHLCARRPHFEEWHWVVILYRAFSLPMGLFEYLVEFLPMPRMARWHLMRMGRRCELAPQVTARDLCVFADELLTDACVFAGPVQRGLLVRLSRDPAAREYLLQHDIVDAALVETLMTWADVQSILGRMEGDGEHEQGEVLFKASFVMKFFAAMLQFYKHRRRLAAVEHAVATEPGPEQEMAGLASRVKCGMDLSAEQDEAEATWTVSGGSEPDPEVAGEGAGAAAGGGLALGVDFMEDDDSDDENQNEGETEEVRRSQFQSALFSDDEDEEEVQLAPIIFDRFPVNFGYGYSSYVRRTSSGGAASGSADGVMSAQYQSVLRQHLDASDSVNDRLNESIGESMGDQEEV